METSAQFAAAVLRPNSDTFFRLKTKLEDCDVTWIQHFDDHSGVDRLLDTLALLGNGSESNSWSSVSDAILQLDCIECVQAILNSPIGVDVLTPRPGRLAKLVSGTTTLLHAITPSFRSSWAGLFVVLTVQNSLHTLKTL